MSREEFIKEAERLKYSKKTIQEILDDLDELGITNYEAFPLIEQPMGEL